jgi:hypothetical protein
LAAAVLTGAAFRLIWLSDMEYKSDEAWTFERVKAFLQTGEAPAIGMMSSASVPNAGLSIWLFLALGYITHALTPLTLARAVQIANVVALLLLAVFALQMVSRREREPWLWATALVAVNPLSVLFSRKIWPPDLFPLFTLGFLTAWWRRSSWIGAFCWGLIGALLGQIQLGGFLFAASFALVTLIYDRRSVDWPAWFTGSVMGIAPMVPWLNLLLHDAAGTSKMTLWPPKLQFLLFFLYWPGFATGLDLPYALGHDFLRFLASPFIGSVPTCLSGIVFAAVVVLWARLIGGFVFRAKAGGARARHLSARTPSALALAASFAVYGPLYILVGGKVHLHYLIITFPLPALSMIWLADAGAPKLPRLLLGSLTLAMAMLTMLFLVYIHNAEYIQGDYRAPYRATQTQGVP